VVSLRRRERIDNYPQRRIDPGSSNLLCKHREFERLEHFSAKCHGEVLRQPAGCSTDSQKTSNFLRKAGRQATGETDLFLSRAWREFAIAELPISNDRFGEADPPYAS
jgi:hypothetical protein